MNKFKVSATPAGEIVLVVNDGGNRLKLAQEDAPTLIAELVEAYALAAALRAVSHRAAA